MSRITCRVLLLYQVVLLTLAATTANLIIPTNNSVIAYQNTNATFTCTVKAGTKPLKFVWFQDEKTNNTQRSTTRLLQEKRYEIIEETDEERNTASSILYLWDLKTTDTSLFICWVHDTDNAFAINNFSLTVVEDLSRSNKLLDTIKDFFKFSDEGPSALTIAVIIFTIIVLFCIATFLIVIRRHSKQDNEESINDGHQHDLMINFESGDEYSDGGRISTSQTTQDYNLDGFMDVMRSGIINMDHHSMSPVFQFNSYQKPMNPHNNQHNNHHHFHPHHPPPHNHPPHHIGPHHPPLPFPWRDK